MRKLFSLTILFSVCYKKVSNKINLRIKKKILIRNENKNLVFAITNMVIAVFHLMYGINIKSFCNAFLVQKMYDFLIQKKRV